MILVADRERATPRRIGNPSVDRSDLTTRELRRRPVRVSEEDAAELAEAQADLRQMARDIAAGDRSPATLRRRLARKRSPRKTVPTDLPVGPQSAGESAEQDGAPR